MKILFNSDLLFATSLIKDKLPRQVFDFLLGCRDKGHEIVIPLTTLLEFNKKQNEFVNKEIAALNSARSKLTDYGIKVEEFKPSDLVKPPDLIQLIKATGISCVLEEPTKNDYENAHRRACLKESPHPPDTKSDEMRDLVIWEISLRVAKENSGAILMSRDEVHIHHRGDKEASEYGLIRCNSIERAYESLSIETVSAQIIKKLIGKVWNEIIDSTLPIVDGGQVVSITNPIFINTDRESSIVTCNANFHTGNGKELSSLLSIEFADDHPFVFKFKDIKINDTSSVEDVILNFEKPVVSDADLNERLNNLKELMRG
jgi:hypothetical protein